MIANTTSNDRQGLILGVFKLHCRIFKPSGAALEVQHDGDKVGDRGILSEPLYTLGEIELNKYTYRGTRRSAASSAECEKAEYRNEVIIRWGDAISDIGLDWVQTILQMICRRSK